MYPRMHVRRECAYVRASVYLSLPPLGVRGERGGWWGNYCRSRYSSSSRYGKCKVGTVDTYQKEVQ